MSEQTIAQSLTELVDLVAQGKPMDAFDKFYHPNLEKTDLDGVTVLGLAQNYQQGLSLLHSITTVRDFSHKGTVIVGDRSFLIWHIDFDSTTSGTVNVTEVAIQDWQDGRIIRERFVA
ncbi:hypothetical protein [Spirosoma areae]